MMDNYIRLADLGDTEEVLELCKNFYDASPYLSLGFDRDKGREFLDGIAHSDKRNFVVLLGLSDSRTIGVLVGAAMEPVFSSRKVATELGWWVEPEFRNSRASLVMYQAYEDWAARVGCHFVQGAYLPGCGPDLSNFYIKRGYKAVEASYIKELK